jgi:hypothetical protein
MTADADKTDFDLRHRVLEHFDFAIDFASGDVQHPDRAAAMRRLRDELATLNADTWNDAVVAAEAFKALQGLPGIASSGDSGGKLGNEILEWSIDGASDTHARPPAPRSAPDRTCAARSLDDNEFPGRPARPRHHRPLRH